MSLVDSKLDPIKKSAHKQSAKPAFDVEAESSSSLPSAAIIEHEEPYSSDLKTLEEWK